MNTRKVLTVENQWESLTWFVDHVKFTDLNKIKCIILKKRGQSFLIKKNMIRIDFVRVPYSDMGHEYTGDSDHIFIKQKTPIGFVAEIPLYDLMEYHGYKAEVELAK